MFLAITLLVVFIAVKKAESKKPSTKPKKVKIKRARISLFAPANDRKGLRGEIIVTRSLERLIARDEFILTNLLLPLRNGRKTELDCVLISKKGIFCVEIKYWVGKISGSDKDEYWLQEYDDPAKDNVKRRNPVMQNEGHVQALMRTLGNKYSVYNVVIFPRLEYPGNIVSHYVYTLSEFREFYNDLDADETLIGELDYIYETLLPFIASDEDLRIHKENIARKYDN